MNKKQQDTKLQQELEELRKHPVNNFICQTCDGGKKVYTGKEFTDHLKDVHKVDPQKMQGKRQMTMHIDCENSFSSHYHWTVPIADSNTWLEFDQFIEMARSKPML